MCNLDVQESQDVKDAQDMQDVLAESACRMCGRTLGCAVFPDIMSFWNFRVRRFFRMSDFPGYHDYKYLVV